MELGFITTCFPDWSMSELIEFSAREGFTTLEVAAWPTWKRVPLVATHIDCETIDSPQVASLKKHLSDAGVSIFSLGYYANFLDVDEEMRAKVHKHMYRVIDVAADLGVNLVSTVVGRDITLSVEQNFDLLAERFDPFVEHATRRGVRIALENCAMEGWNPQGATGNIAFSPEIWDVFFQRYPAESVGINYDPSHFVWLGIDPPSKLEKAAPRLFEVHVKDTIIDQDRLNEYGFFGRQVNRDPWDMGWWRFTIPGLGQIDWDDFVRALLRVGYDNALILEVEDFGWMQSPERVQRALQISKAYLEQFLL